MEMHLQQHIGSTNYTKNRAVAESKNITVTVSYHLSVEWLATRVVVVPHQHCNCTAAASTEPDKNTKQESVNKQRMNEKQNEATDGDFPRMKSPSTRHSNLGTRWRKNFNVFSWLITTLILHPFNGPLSRTTQVSRYQKGKTNLDFTEVRDSEWQWHQPGHMQVCTLLQTDNHATPHHSSFLQAGCHSCHPTNSVKALKATQVIPSPGS